MCSRSRTDEGALATQGVGQVSVAGTFGGLDQRQVQQVALRVAAPEAGRHRAHAAQQLRGLGVAAQREVVDRLPNDRRPTRNQPAATAVVRGVAVYADAPTASAGSPKMQRSPFGHGAAVRAPFIGSGRTP